MQPAVRPQPPFLVANRERIGESIAAEHQSLLGSELALIEIAHAVFLGLRGLGGELGTPVNHQAIEFIGVAEGLFVVPLCFLKIATERRRINMYQGKGSTGWNWIAGSRSDDTVHGEKLGRFEIAVAARQALGLELDHLRRSAGLARVNAVPERDQNLALEREIFALQLVLVITRGAAFGDRVLACLLYTSRCV